MYTMEIIHLDERQANILQVAFKDRPNIIIEMLPPFDVDATGVLDVTISNIHPVTMTPLIMWILHHIEKRYYNEIKIS